jgi:GxxExxY protein
MNKMQENKGHKEGTEVHKVSMIENEISNKIIGHAIEVHRLLGPGLLESAYRQWLFHELTKDGFFVEKEKPMPLIYKDIKLDQGYRMDLLVENKVVIEIKTVEDFTDVHFAQLLTYLKLGNYKLGLLINFHVSLLKNGIKRIIN